MSSRPEPVLPALSNAEVSLPKHAGTSLHVTPRRYCSLRDPKL